MPTTAIPESREVSEMHANRLAKAWLAAYTPGQIPHGLFTKPQFDEKILAFRDDVLHTVKNNVDHGRGIAFVLGERILAWVRKVNNVGSGPVMFEWTPAEPEDPQAWEQAAQTILTDISRGDYADAGQAFDYLVATSNDEYTPVAQLVGAFVTANYFLRNPENSSESA